MHNTVFLNRSELLVPFKSLFQRLTGNSTTSSNAEQAPPTGGFSELGVEKLKAVISEVTNAFPLFEKAGFEIEEVQVEIGIAPKLMPRFRHVKDISVSDQEAILEEVKDKQLIKFMLISLFKSSKMKNLIQDPKLNFHAIEIDLTAVPSVRGIFKAVTHSDRIVRLKDH